MKIYKNPNVRDREKIKEKAEMQVKFKCDNCGKDFLINDNTPLKVLKYHFCFSNGSWGVGMSFCSKECKRQKLILLAL